MNTIGHLIETGDRSRPALVDIDGTTLTRDEVSVTLERLSTQLLNAGVHPGDRVAIVLPNGPEMALVFLAVSMIACAAPLNPGYSQSEFAFYLDDLGATTLITDNPHLLARDAALPDVLRLEAVGSMASLQLEGATSSHYRVEGTDRLPDDVALVLHTSGTTSRPKIVPLRHRNLVRSAVNVVDSLELGTFDRSLTVMPLFHIHGLVAGLLAPLAGGGSVVCARGFNAFQFHSWLEDLQPTYYSAVPTIHQLILDRSQGTVSSSLRFIRSSSAALPARVFNGLTEVFGVPVIESYGMTEASHQMTSNQLKQQKAKRGSVGRPVGVDLAILDASGDVLPPDSVGEVGVRGPTIIEEYENNEKATKEAFTKDGWFRTGDEGYVDSEGYLYLTGRIKEQINRGGEKVSPIEVDEALLRFKEVEQAVTFAIPHDILGEEVAAAIVLRDGVQLSAKDIRSGLREFLAAFKVPRYIYFVDEIPKGPTGKLQRIGLVDRISSAPDS